MVFGELGDHPGRFGMVPYFMQRCVVDNVD